MLLQGHISGEFTMEYSRYSPARAATQEKIIKDQQAKLDEDAQQKTSKKKKN